ncbi:MAG: transporter substrate-binding domain-containing protein [Lachnospiraceae bacterium]|nr:transporter substrate-binding domain-containing protein [Lachnospiraceae bacterium]
MKGKQRYVKMTLLACLVIIIGGFFRQDSATVYADTNEAKEATEQSETEKIRVAVNDFPCYLTLQKDDTPYGAAYEYLKEIQKYTDWEYEFVRMSFEEAIEAIKNGTVDILPGCQMTEEREEIGDFSELSMGQGSIVLCTLPAQTQYMFNDFESYAGMRIAVLKGTLSYSQAQEFFDTKGVEVEFVEYESDGEAKAALAAGKVDAVLMANVSCEKDYKIIARILSMPWYFMLNQSRPEIKEQLDEAMYQIRLEEPYYEAMLDDKYFPGILKQVTMSEEEKQYIENAGVITVALSVDMSPIEYYDEKSGTYRGIVVDTFDAIHQITGLQFRFVAKEQREELQRQMKDDEVQLIGLVAASDRNVESLHVAITEAYSNGSVTVVINSAVADYKELDNRVVVVNSTPFFELMVKELGYTDIVYAETFEKCVDMVNRGKADISMIPDYSMDQLINYPRYRNITALAYPDSIYDYCIGVSAYTDSHLLTILNKAISNISEETRTNILIENLTSYSADESLVDFFYRYNTSIFVVVCVVLLVITCIVTYIASYRQHINKQLKLAVGRANTASQAKTEFLSRMSHDLRTPLNAVIGYSDPLMNETATVEEKIGNLTKINMSGKYLLELLNDVLDMVKAENGKLKLHYHPASIEGFFQEIDAVIRPLAEEKGISFEIHNYDDKREYVISAQVRVKQIFLNLLNNAIKFTPRGGHIRYEVYKLKVENGRVYNRFRVVDDGIGISPEFLPHIFEPFVQEDVQRGEGSGLGLAIVEKLVEELGGSITVSSKPNEGTEFVVDLSFELCDEFETERQEAKKAATKELPEGILAGKRVLLCEDHPINAEIAKRMLERVGMQVEVAQDGQQAMECYKAAQGNYDVILMDIRMPVMDGLETASWIREKEKENGRHTPIIVMTANAFEDDKEQAEKVGMSGYIAKPIDSALLYQMLSEVCNPNCTK